MKQIFVHRAKFRIREKERVKRNLLLSLRWLFSSLLFMSLVTVRWQTSGYIINLTDDRNFAHFSSCCFWFPFAPYTQLVNPTHMFINNLSKIFKIQVLEVLSHLCHTPRRRQRCLVCVTNLVSFKCRLFMMTQKFCFDPDYVHLHFHINNKIPCGWKFTSFMYKYYTHDKDRSFFAYNLSL